MGLEDNRLDADEKGEAIASAINKSDKVIYIVTGEDIGELKVATNTPKPIWKSGGLISALTASIQKESVHRYPKGSNKRIKTNKEARFVQNNPVSVDEPTDEEMTKDRLIKLQDQWINKGKSPKVITICDQDGGISGRKRKTTVDNKAVRVRGKLLNKVSKIDWVDPMFMATKWSFIIPYNKLSHGAGDLALL